MFTRDQCQLLYMWTPLAEYVKKHQRRWFVFSRSDEAKLGTVVIA